MQEVIKKYSRKYGIPAGLINAIITVESSKDPFAMRYEKHYSYLYRPEHFAEKHSVTLDTEITAQKMSWGPMQVMGATARELGFDGRFLSQLTEPEQGIKFGCMYLKKQFNRYKNWNDAIAAYNAGSARRSNNKYVNQRYVDKVLMNWR